jgi:hypothetical protein
LTFRVQLGTDSTPTALNMIIAAPRSTLLKKMSSGSGL